MATVKSKKADVSSVSPSSERYRSDEGLMLNKLTPVFLSIPRFFLPVFGFSVHVFHFYFYFTSSFGGSETKVSLCRSLLPSEGSFVLKTNPDVQNTNTFQRTACFLRGKSEKRNLLMGREIKCVWKTTCYALENNIGFL